MSNYRKTMGQAIEEMYPINEDNMDLMRKAAGGAMQKIKMKDGKLQMDSFTASAIMKVYDKVNPANQKKMATMINKGTKDGMMKLQDFAMKQVKSENDPEIEEDVDLDEADDFKPHMMYDPKTGKGYKADTMDDHLRMKKMGYTHDAPKTEEVELDEAKYTRKLMKDKSVVDYVKSQQARNRKKEQGYEHGANWVELAAKTVGMEKMSLSKRKAFDWESEYEAVAKKLGEEVDLDEGKLGDQWQKGAKSVKSGSFELVRGKSGVHDIMKSGKKIGTFSYDDEGDNFVANMKGERGQLVGNDIDTLISNFKEEVDLDEVDRSTYDDRIKKFTGMLKDAEKEKPLDKEWISILKGHIKKTNAAQRRLLGMSEDVGLDEGKMKDLLIKAQELMGPSKNRKEGIQMVAKGLKVSEKEATKLVDEVIKMKMNEEVDLDESNKLPDMRNALMQVRTGEVDLDEAQDGGDFKPHMMYDPKTGKGYKADTMDDHLRMKKMGYNHDAPKTEEVGLDEESLDDFQDFARSYGGGDEIYVVTQGKDSNSQKVIGIEKDPNKAKKIRDGAKGFKARIYGQMKSQQKVLKLKIGDPVSFEDSKNKLSFIEEVDLDEGKMSQLHQYIKDKKSAEEIAKLMKVDVKTIKTLMSSNNPEDVEESAASDARRAMAKDKDFSRKDSADDDDDATDDDVKGASKNIIMQMRKAQSLNGRFPVEFADKKKVKIPAKMAIAVQQKYNAMKKPADKEKFQAKIGKSYKDMLSALKEELQPKKESILERMNRKIKENKDG